MRQWRLIYGSPTAGSLNMAIDEAILMAESVRPTLRFYAWQPYCLSLGYGQRVEDVDEAHLRDAGYDLVRRPTGGRAVLHAHELTYSLILPPDHPIADDGVIPSYRRISRALLTGLNHLGVQSAARKQELRGQQNGPVCFEMPSHYEVTARGRKLIGSAQLRRKAGILQHGSLPLDGDIDAICDVLYYPDDASREQSKQQVRQRAITLYDALGGVSVSWQQAANAILEGFQQTFDLDFEVRRWTTVEQTLAHDLERTVYGSPEWTNRR